ncbi:F-box/FBD/LRR-repeat protein At1g13570-like [Lycium barbarum]|uniref:F-box/FBD/LRR-repeat protein At1g13570-like n=1 Tax=Lycium barbarum TaxID=112863 RepID=UPI00293EB335|nr:F-box/FBD/LRR-repeat protein At1g13570-like [Lycium barbarum]
MIGRCCKRLKVEGDKFDRLTDLPIDVQHQIQEYLSREEAARMGVLSRAWRHVFASIPKLVFSAQFCQRKPSDTLIDIIRTILLQHDGTIKTFLLNMSSIPSSQHSIIDQWMLLLSRNGVMDLTLQNLHSAPYKLPSYVYGVELQSLSLSNCIFRAPCSFRGFHKLKKLSLHKVALELDNPTSFLWMPNLVVLLVRLCSGFPNLKIYAPELCGICFVTWSTETLELGHFMDCRKLKTVILGTSRNNQR